VVAELLGGFDAATTVVVGDRPESDGAFAATLGCRFVLVRSGVLVPGAPSPRDVVVATDVADLATFVGALDVPVPPPRRR
jgi:ribonucleotide monophosphatase NagD (HAD superfamily)